jgi:hypothetical protein
MPLIFCLKWHFENSTLCLFLNKEPTLLGPVDRASSKNIVTYGVWVTNNNGFWILWIGFIGLSNTITTNYHSSHIELHLNDVCLTNLYEKSLAALNARMNSLLTSTRPEYKSPSRTVNCPVILFFVTGMSLLIFVAAETGDREPLPSKMTSASASVPAFRQRLPSRCYQWIISSQYVIFLSILFNWGRIT